MDPYFMRRLMLERQEEQLQYQQGLEALRMLHENHHQHGYLEDMLSGHHHYQHQHHDNMFGGHHHHHHYHDDTPHQHYHPYHQHDHHAHNHTPMFDTMHNHQHDHHSHDQAARFGPMQGHNHLHHGGSFNRQRSPHGPPQGGNNDFWPLNYPGPGPHFGEYPPTNDGSWIRAGDLYRPPKPEHRGMAEILVPNAHGDMVQARDLYAPPKRELRGMDEFWVRKPSPGPRGMEALLGDHAITAPRAHLDAHAMQAANHWRSQANPLSQREMQSDNFFRDVLELGP